MHERKFDGETNCSGVVNFHAMQTSLTRFIFGDD